MMVKQKLTHTIVCRIMRINPCEFSIMNSVIDKINRMVDTERRIYRPIVAYNPPERKDIVAAAVAISSCRRVSL